MGAERIEALCDAFSEKLEEEGFVRALPKKGAFVTFGEQKKVEEPDKKSVIYAFKDMGISKQTLINWIEEVYKDD